MGRMRSVMVILFATLRTDDPSSISAFSRPSLSEKELVDTLNEDESRRQELLYRAAYCLQASAEHRENTESVHEKDERLVLHYPGV